MPRRGKISQLPKEIRDWINRTLIERNFSGYEQFTADANQKLKELGYEFTFGKSAAHRYGSQLERRIAAIKASTEAAVMIADAAPDDEDKRSGAVVSMIQTEIFETILKLQEADAADPAERVKLLSAAAKNIATLTRASVNLKRFQSEVKAKVRAVADAAAKIGRKGGLSKAGVEEIRREILGIAAQ